MTLMLNPATGLLPVGEHEMKWRKVCELFGTTIHRKYLLELLHSVCIVLREAGVAKIWLNGSFVTSKERPNDYDLSYVLTEEIFAKLPDDPFKQEKADTLIKGQYAGDIKAEPMSCGATYHQDLFPNVIGHSHNGKPIEGEKKGIIILILADLPDNFDT